MDHRPRPNQRRWPTLLAWLVVGVIAHAARANDPVSYNRDVRPILAERCFKCHGRDESDRRGELRLDLREQAIETAIVPGNADDSEIIARVASDDPDIRMPPPGAHKAPLTADEVETLRQWIDRGAEYEQHWAFIPPERPDVPRLSRPPGIEAGQADWTASPIDTFVLARLQAEGLHSAPQADRTTLIRRVTLDLTGLPPTPAELDAFLSDGSAEAYERVVDRLLTSRHYGEHIARYWLDAARYADTNGFLHDLNRDQWAWRDWVIRALNDNMPFDQFTIEQLAGDLLPDATDQQRLATAFNRHHPITNEGGVIDEEYRTEYVIDRVVTTSTVWMGMTMLCARCHDHKYDPISQREFYGIMAYFNQVPEKGVNGFDPRLDVASPLRAELLAAVDEQIVAAEARYAHVVKDVELDNAQLESQVIAEGSSVWQTVVPESMTSTGGTELTVLDDRSVLASGTNPDKDTYELFLSTEGKVGAIRLEALVDPSLGGGGTGREPDGNFVLSEFEVAAAPPGRFDQLNKLKFANAESDYAQQGFEIAGAIDGKTDDGGWAVDGDRLRQPRTAVFRLGAPGGFEEGTLLRIRLVHEFGNSHQIGRFRISVADADHVPPPLAVLQVLNIPDSERDPSQREQLRDYLIGRFGPPEVLTYRRPLEQLRARRNRLEAIPATMVMTDMAEPRTTYVLHRGEYDKPGDPVTADTPEVLPPLSDDVPRNRLGFAHWLVMPRHPLTARVTVNRIWQRLLGTGLVKTAEDFGTQGEPPSHPNLLDWLAVEFVESGWDVKHMHKLIVMSATYRQSSNLGSSPSTPHSIDPENRFLSRGPRLRLDAEVIRDSVLFVSGLLVPTVGGPSVFPYHPSGLWQEINSRPGSSQIYQQDRGDGLYRRSLYTYWKRTVPPPSMATFDAPSREYCVVQRSRTNTPLQAFVMLHDPQMIEAARHLAVHIMREGGDSTRERLAYGFRRCTARFPADDEQMVLDELFAERRRQYADDPDAGQQLLAVGETSPDASLDRTEYAAFTSVARVLLNLSEFVTKE